MDQVASLCLKLYSGVDAISIRDCFRLGRFDKVASGPRPLLVKFTQSADVIRILSKRGALSKPFILKEAMSLQQRAVEAVVLKERRSLSQSDKDHTAIKIRKGQFFMMVSDLGR